MPFIETPEEMAEAICDLAGIYGSHGDETCSGGEDLRYSCRVCAVPVLVERMRLAVMREREMEKVLAAKGGAT